MGPIVYLIGTGPGDPGLITARGLHAVTTAFDVLIYDHLHSPALAPLRQAGDVERIDVGLQGP